MINDKELITLIENMYELKYQLSRHVEDIENNHTPDVRTNWVHKSACEISALINDSPDFSKNEPF
jgi:hypothetical protein